MVDSYYVIFIKDWIEFSVATVSLFCSFFTLYLIKSLKVWNGNLLLITSLTCFQVLYDVNFLFGVSGYYSTCLIWNFLDIFGGLATSFTTNAIAYTMIYTVVRIRSINVFKNYPYFFIFFGIIPLIVACLTMTIITHANRDDDKPYTDCVYNSSNLATFIQEFYYWSRLGSIVFNFLAFWYLSYKIKRLGFVESMRKFVASSVSLAFAPGRMVSRVVSLDVTGPGTGTVGVGGITGIADNQQMTVAQQQLFAVKILVSRMRLYPLAQAICRVGSAWNEYNNYQYSNNTSSLTAAVLSPLSGVFYMIVFLIMQPNAWKICKKTFHKLKKFICSGFDFDFATRSTTVENPSIHLNPQLNMNDIFRGSSNMVDDSVLESIINHPDSNSLLEWDEPSKTIVVRFDKMKNLESLSPPPDEERNSTVNMIHRISGANYLSKNRNKGNDDEKDEDNELM